eukprot:gene18011-21493_t
MYAAYRLRKRAKNLSKTALVLTVLSAGFGSIGIISFLSITKSMKADNIYNCPAITFCTRFIDPNGTGNIGYGPKSGFWLGTAAIVSNVIAIPLFIYMMRNPAVEASPYAGFNKGNTRQRANQKLTTTKKKTRKKASLSSINLDKLQKDDEEDDEEKKKGEGEGEGDEDEEADDDSDMDVDDYGNNAEDDDDAGSDSDGGGEPDF